MSLFFAKSYHVVTCFNSKHVLLFLLDSLSSVILKIGLYYACLLVFLTFASIKILGLVPVSLHIFQVYDIDFGDHSDYAEFSHLFADEDSRHILTLFHCMRRP